MVCSIRTQKSEILSSQQELLTGMPRHVRVPTWKLRGTATTLTSESRIPTSEVNRMQHLTCIWCLYSLLVSPTCRMLHCWMAVCCSWLASCCRFRAVRQMDKLVTTSSGTLRALWHSCTASTCCLKLSMSANKRWKNKQTFYKKGFPSLYTKLCNPGLQKALNN